MKHNQHGAAKSVATEWTSASGPTLDAFVTAAAKLSDAGWLPYSPIRYHKALFGAPIYVQKYTRLYCPIKRKAEIEARAASE